MILQLKSILGILLLLSAISLSVGGYLLYVNSLVPLILVETTFVAVIILYILSYFVAKGNMISINVSTVLGIIAPIMSAATPAHVGVLEEIVTGGLISFLGLLQLLGFYVFPITFVIMRIFFRASLTNWKY
jgi:hypothetical protein